MWFLKLEFNHSSHEGPRNGQRSLKSLAGQGGRGPRQVDDLELKTSLDNIS